MNVTHTVFREKRHPLEQYTLKRENERLPGSAISGSPFPEATINAVWEKAQKEFGFFFYRKDCCSAVIAKHEYGKKTRYGWVIDHIVPVAKGGTDDIDNLQPLHWENNLSKGDDYPEWTCKRKI